MPLEPLHSPSPRYLSKVLLRQNLPDWALEHPRPVEKPCQVRHVAELKAAGLDADTGKDRVRGKEGNWFKLLRQSQSRMKSKNIKKWKSYEIMFIWKIAPFQSIFTSEGFTWMMKLRDVASVRLFLPCPSCFLMLNHCHWHQDVRLVSCPSLSLLSLPVFNIM